MATAPRIEFSDEPQEFETVSGMHLIDPSFHEEHFPWRQTIGFLASLGLTFAALAIARSRALSALGLTAIVLALAAGQAGIQLGVFMHLRESRGPAWQVPMLALGIVIALGIVGMSIWVMTFKWGVS